MNVLLITPSTRIVSDIIAVFMSRGMTLFHYPTASKCLPHLTADVSQVFGTVLVDVDADAAAAEPLLTTIQDHLSQSPKQTGIHLIGNMDESQKRQWTERFGIHSVFPVPFDAVAAFKTIYNHRRQCLQHNLDEKRLHFRVSPEVGEDVTVYFRSDDNKLVGETLKNISSGGLLLSSREHDLYVKSKEYYFQLSLLGQRIDFLGMVVFAQKGLVGIKYTKIDENGITAICKYIFTKINRLNIRQYVRHEQEQPQARKPTAKVNHTDEETTATDEETTATDESASSRVLAPLIKHYDVQTLAGKPLPVTIYNAQGTVRAQAGQTVNEANLHKSYIYTEAAAETHVPQPDRPSATDADYEEESAGQLEKRLDSTLYFVPYQAAKEALRNDLKRTKSIFEKKMIQNVAKLHTTENERISREIAASLDGVLDVQGHSGDYIDMVNALRTKDNYLTFSHSCSVAFYSLAIAKKLKMLQDDFFVHKQLGRWRPIKTARFPEAGGAKPFSVQLLRYLDLQEMSIRVKYKPPVSDSLIEQLHDTCHEYARIDWQSTIFPSMRINFCPANLQLITMAALNHDIGKVSVPPRILNKPTKLSPKEFEVMKLHPAIGVKRLKEIGVNQPRLFAYILGHHILSDNRGYPNIKKRPLPESKIIAIADIYDAMRSETHYKRPHNQEKTLNYIYDLYCEGCFDAPLYVTAVHTFRQFNHEHVRERYSESRDHSA